MNKRIGAILVILIILLTFIAGALIGYYKEGLEKYKEAYIANVEYSSWLQREIDSLDKQIIAQGEFIAQGKALQELTLKELGEFEATHYAYGSKTKSGTTPAVGRTVAVDPKVIPLGSILYIEGYGLRIAEDTGGLIKGNIVDVYVGSKAEALELGRKKGLRIWLVEGTE